MSIFKRSVTCSFFLPSFAHILTRTQGEKLEYTFLVKIASKGTSLNTHLENLPFHVIFQLICIVENQKSQYTVNSIVRIALPIKDVFPLLIDNR